MRPLLVALLLSTCALGCEQRAGSDAALDADAAPPTDAEAGAFDGDPDGFVRGFVRTVADGLGLDADATLLRMLREPATAGVDANEEALMMAIEVLDDAKAD